MFMRFLLATILAAPLGILFASPAQADLQVPSILADHMVLQQGRDDALWGWDTPGTTVSVAFRGRTCAAKADGDGRWQVAMPAGAAGGPFPLTITGSTRIALSDVLVGEVWVAGGQSNMWWHVGNCFNAKAEIADANQPNIRYWDANTSPTQAGWGADTPQRTVQAHWQPTSPAVVADFAGVPYFFARDLHRALRVPVGIVHLAVPGTEIEQHLSPAFLQKNMPQAMELYTRQAKDYSALQQQYQTSHAAWEKDKQGNEPKPPDAPNRPGQFYNGMIAPTAPFTCRGFLWWQGEYNASRYLQYRVLFPGLIEEWRQIWNDDSLPFLFVELANFGPPQTQSVEEADWPSLRDAQREALRLPRTYEVSAIDVKQPEEGDWAIHPAHKQIVGHRLFLAAMANVYAGPTIEWSGPTVRSFSINNDALVVNFAHLNGVQAPHPASLQGFALAGLDRVFHAATATVAGTAIVLKCKEVPHPVAARYDWANNPTGTLRNRDGLPAFPFRTDQWNLK